MAPERSAAASLSRILFSASTATGGIREVLRTLNLGALATLPVHEVYAALVDLVCPADGALDDAYAREAYLEAVADVMARGLDLEVPTDEAAVAFIGSFIANAVRLRIINAIANRLVTMPTDIATCALIDAGLMDFVRGCVNDALAQLPGDIPANALSENMDRIFERVVDFIDDVANGLTEEDE